MNQIQIIDCVAFYIKKMMDKHVESLAFPNVRQCLNNRFVLHLNVDFEYFNVL